MINGKIEKLRAQIIRHDLLYSQDKPVITDSEYDTLYIELSNLEEKHPELITPDSPTQKIYGAIVEGLEKVKHTEPMLSQAKIKTRDEISKYVSDIQGDILVQEKLDGLTVVLTYDGGKLIDAVTRGSGTIGERILHTAHTVKNVPKSISYKGRLVVRGEAVIPFDEFNRIVETEDYSNPRNLVSGTMRQLDASVAHARNVKIIVFEYIESSSLSFSQDTERLDFLKENNFDVVNYKVFKSGDFEGIKNYCESYNKTVRPTLAYMIDGLVLKSNNIIERISLGSTSKHPKWSCAYKFESLDAITTLRRVVWQVGKTGQLTPVAEFDTVNIDGVNIERATLHNMDYINIKDIQVGDKIVVARANDVIPQVVQALVSERQEGTSKIQMPIVCPSCGSVVSKVINADGAESASIFCGGLNCKPQMLGRINHFVSRNAMNIDGLGPKTIEVMVNNGIINSFADLFEIVNKPHAFDGLEGFGEKKYSKMIEEVEGSKERPLNQVLYSFSIPMVGETVSKLIAKNFSSMDNILEKMERPTTFMSELSNVPGIGNVASENFIKFIEANKVLIVKLMDLGVKMETEPAETYESQITGKTFVITGKLDHYANRDALVAVIEKCGGKEGSSVSKNTDFLINNDSTSTSGKNKKATELGVKIITENEFIEMIK